MTRDASQDTGSYKVVVNGEDQYSIWPAGRDNPAGWIAEGECGSKAECLAYIKKIWIDMRPRSVKIQMTKHEQAR